MVCNVCKATIEEGVCSYCGASPKKDNFTIDNFEHQRIQIVNVEPTYDNYKEFNTFVLLEHLGEVREFRGEKWKFYQTCKDLRKGLRQTLNEDPENDEVKEEYEKSSDLINWSLNEYKTATYKKNLVEYVIQEKTGVRPEAITKNLIGMEYWKIIDDLDAQEQVEVDKQIEYGNKGGKSVKNAKKSQLTR